MKGKMSIRDTKSFKEALDDDDLESCEAWLDYVRKYRGTFPDYDDRWLDHRERDLFNAACEAKAWSMAKRVVEITASESSKSGRRARLEELSGRAYDDIPDSDEED